MPIPTSLAFVDLETTGATATHDRITEIGIVTVDAGGTVSEWSTLVNPGTLIPPFIESLTGISNAMVRHAPGFDALAAEVAERLAGRLFIAHNARFDYGFLKQEFARLGIAFQAEVLCTVKLSRKLFPGHAKHSLDALIARHNLVVEGRHRALADARLIHQFWQQAHLAHASEVVAEAVKAQLLRPSLPSHIDVAAIEAIPEGHGVYLFYGENNLPLYVGKSKTLRKRVMAHFSADTSSAKEMSLSQQVKRIDWIETAGEIGALLRESALIKELLPTHNRLLRRNSELCSWQLGGPDLDTLSLQLTYASDSDFGRRDNLYGLFKTARDAKKSLQMLADSHGLCPALLGLETHSAGKPCFARQLRKCRGACVGKESARQHSGRLIAALAELHLTAWPFNGPAILREGPEAHLVDGWAYLGTAKSDEELQALLENGHAQFDRDTYHILSRMKHRLQALPTSAQMRAGPGA